MILSEAYRCRQVHRYRGAWQEVQALLRGYEGPACKILLEPGAVKFPVSSSDKSLTAFAQLATLRLNADRAIISLIDSTTQYILAEATQSLSLVDDTRHALDDQLSMGESERPCEGSLCASVLESTTKIKDASGEDVEVNALVIADALEDDRYKSNSLVVQEKIRFFASVPILTRTGIKIGAYSVISSEKRLDLTHTEVNFLQDVAEAIFEHLLLVKGRLDSIRGAKMVAGLTSFVSATEDKQSLFASKKQKTGDIRVRDDMRATIPSHSKDSGSASSATSKKFSRGKESLRFSQRTYPKTQDHKQPSLTSSIEEKPTILSSADQPSEISSSQQASSLPHHSSSKRDDVNAGNIDSEVEKVFSRAAHALRRSTFADGCIFFNAISKGVDRYTRDFESRDSTSDERSESGSTFYTQPDNDYMDNNASDQLNRPSDVLAISLAQSYGQGNIFNVTEHDLRRCIHRYRRGKIFHFSEAGVISSGRDQSSDTTRSGLSSDTQTEATDSVPSKRQTINERSRRHHKFIAEEILQIIPGVKNVIFLPMYEQAKNRWFAGAFLWSMQADRLMDANDELLYLRAFAHAIMSEVSRLDAVVSERAKTTFIASISHELRSPLHGILGSIEFLHESKLDMSQRGLVTSIETCGKTLLDTIDHVLDYAKINFFNQKQTSLATVKEQAQHASRSGLLSTMTITTNFDLCLLVEEVVDAIYAGQVFRQGRVGHDTNAFDDHDAAKSRGIMTRPDKDIQSQLKKRSHEFSDRLCVIMDMDPSLQDMVQTQPGLLRRIVMNLFGNALKYTEKGYVKVTCRRVKATSRYQSGVALELIVQDTGKGMSEDFLRDKLYKPFSQEDSFSVGTGLGLSIVRQLVNSLQGTIQINSKKGEGTAITIHLDLPTVSNVQSQLEREQITTIAKSTTGMKLCILRAATEDNDAKRTRGIMEDTLKKLIEEWFGMEVRVADRMEGIETDIFLYPEPPAIDHLLEQHNHEASPTVMRSRTIPLIVVCTNAFEEAALQAAGIRHLTQLGRCVNVISQPIGPSTFSLALKHCLEAIKASEDGGSIGSRNALSSREDLSEIANKEMAKTQEDREQEQHRHQFHPPSELPNLPKNIPQTHQRPPELISDEAQFSDHMEHEDGSSILALQQKQVLPINTEIRQSMSQQTATELHGTTSIPSSIGLTSKPFVLLVDDNAINLRLLTTFMKKISLDHVSAINGLEALNSYREHYKSGRPFDFVLMDISMPVMDGINSTQEIRKFERESGGRKATIVALTGMASKTMQEEAFRTGFDHFFSKPVKFKELKALLVNN